MATQIMMSKVNALSGAVVKRVTEQHYQQQYCHGIDMDESLEEQLIEVGLFCQKQGWIIDVNEYEQSPAIYPNLSLNIGFCKQQNIQIIVPIFIGKAFYGLFVLGDESKIKQLNWEDRDLLFAVYKAVRKLYFII